MVQNSKGVEGNTVKKKSTYTLYITWKRIQIRACVRAKSLKPCPILFTLIFFVNSYLICPVHSIPEKTILVSFTVMLSGKMPWRRE